MNDDADLKTRAHGFVAAVLEAMALPLEPVVEEQTDCLRIRLDGDGGELLLQKRGAALDALQHVLNAIFRRELPERHRVVVDYQDFRASKDDELRETARVLAARAKETGQPQHLGPLNAYARRIVHLAIAEDPDASTESIGDALMKTIVISWTPTA
ncbi:MAG: R3H domain-containing nucleic acid-binding protein [Vicinamibacterales bacterium]|jgi:spoIIIJ-associated protein|nr:hypothetical protein [Acidobacteriota bacterium]MDP6371750.1 R3H domain-containing nucleic acid-binding protein [Vicinamibacterales bacterium]MDP6609217.1 R3H domain-containing nucleic acid-binding protein [Vicinamibacterales bacterium]|tara:strand:+ start:950 stop:1417 length:468 start_codon:yes stop_codon:yes gene_type:complete